MLATANYLAGRHLPIEISLSVYASAFVILISAILLPFWKSSAHLAGLSGFLALYIGMNAHYSTGNTTTLVTIVALIGLMAWSRLSLNRHTPRELLSGFFIGFTTLYVLLSR
jgi:membrane-associated phospholipid phosphatase